MLLPSRNTDEPQLKKELEQRKCTRCGKIKPLNHFARYVKVKNKYRSQCKKCTKDHRASRGLTIPRENTPYQLTQQTMRNHMYIHFGWWEPQRTALERHQHQMDVKKYYKEEIKPDYKNNN